MKRFSSCLACFLACLFLIGLIPAFADAALTESEINILACSDFQHPDGAMAGAGNVDAILGAMKKDGITSADAMFACGDYDYGNSNTKGGIAYLKNSLKGFVNGPFTFVQGNHDSANSAAGTNGLSQSGNNDPDHEKYGVFVIHEEDYMWYNDDEGMIKNTAQNLIEYLNEKLEKGYDKPIFILSHLGLHYSMRTAKEGFAMHAPYLFNAINEAGAKGLNIFYLFGHNHSNGWDDYLGGASVYLTKGDSMLVPQGNKIAKASRTLAFTYLNAGYIGYYQNVNGQDDALTMTYITIKGNEVSFARYDKNGIHNMKSKGVTNAYKNENAYKPNETEYPSPQTVALTAVLNKAPIPNLLTIDKTQPIWKKISGISELVSGKSYLMLYKGSNDRIMPPVEVTKAYTDGTERIGFDLIKNESFVGNLVYARVENALWTFEKVSGGWLIKKGDASITHQETSDQGIAAILSSTASPLTLADKNGGITVKSGSYYLNLNKRELINFYPSDPATFDIYELVGYGITVNGGSVTKEGTPVKYAMTGDTLTVKANDAYSGYVFEKWEVVSGALTLDDPTKAELTLAMPDSAITLKALYKVFVPDDEPSGGFPTTAVVIVSIAVIFAAATVTVVVLKKKK